MIARCTVAAQHRADAEARIITSPAMLLALRRSCGCASCARINAAEPREPRDARGLPDANPEWGHP
jgi:hypothetical protein